MTFPNEFKSPLFDYLFISVLLFLQLLCIYDNWVTYRQALPSHRLWFSQKYKEINKRWKKLCGNMLNRKVWNVPTVRSLVYEKFTKTNTSNNTNGAAPVKGNICKYLCSAVKWNAASVSVKWLSCCNNYSNCNKCHHICHIAVVYDYNSWQSQLFHFLIFYVTYFLTAQVASGCCCCLLVLLA